MGLQTPTSGWTSQCSESQRGLGTGPLGSTLGLDGVSGSVFGALPTCAEWPLGSSHGVCVKVMWRQTQTGVGPPTLEHQGLLAATSC